MSKFSVQFRDVGKLEVIEADTYFWYDGRVYFTRKRKCEHEIAPIVAEFAADIVRAVRLVEA